MGAERQRAAQNERVSVSHYEWQHAPEQGQYSYTEEEKRMSTSEQRHQHIAIKPCTVA